MARTMTKDNVLHSVSMMLAYLNFFKPKYEEIQMEELLFNLESKIWDGGILSPLEVIHDNEDHISHYRRIIESNLNYPIIIDEKKIIIDGYHGLSLAKILGKENIKVYIFDGNLLEKFIVDEENKNDTSKILDLFYERFF